VGIPREQRQTSLDFWAKDFDAPLPMAPLGFHSFFVVQHSLPLQNSLPTIDTFTLVCVKVTTFFSVRRQQRCQSPRTASMKTIEFLAI
jgi:hypothetical protein